MQCEYTRSRASPIRQHDQKVRQHLNPKLDIEGLLRTMYDPRNALAQQVSAQLQEHFGKKVYETLIPRNVRLAEAPSFGAPAVSSIANAKARKPMSPWGGDLLRSGIAATV